MISGVCMTGLQALAAAAAGSATSAYSQPRRPLRPFAAPTASASIGSSHLRLPLTSVYREPAQGQSAWFVSAARAEVTDMHGSGKK
eukprot:CAMPEP_0171265916 /NCGR_PEP_ID=MMETSP0790-20130122/58374_2 /TAXON_ID=2925 /ORGANISM="Alexandrium catenella, Strain OF101" /LENGTH=85 /DNA_ID=CAMNT_0011734605 /DNA_START=16 /DNA_END=271 /DNA_ORIENTATION=-